MTEHKHITFKPGHPEAGHIVVSESGRAFFHRAPVGNCGQCKGHAKRVAKKVRP